MREHLIHRWKKVLWGGEGASFFESVESARRAPSFLRRLEVPNIIYPDKVYFKIVKNFLQAGEEIGILTENVVRIRYGQRTGLSFVIPAQWLCKGCAEENDAQQEQEQMRRNNRPCTCGSGEPWVSCGANSPYCG